MEYQSTNMQEQTAHTKEQREICAQCMSNNYIYQ